MAVVREGSRVKVPTRRGREAYAGVAQDTQVERLAGNKRRALGPLHLFKRDHPNGGDVAWTLPEGTVFRYISGPMRKE